MSDLTRHTLAEWRAKATELFGDDVMKWKFVCPVCGHIASVQDWKDAGAPAQAAAFSCVGRWAGANPVVSEGTVGPSGLWGKGPCNYAGGGLFKLNPVVVVDPDGVELRAFAFAEPSRDQESNHDGDGRPHEGAARQGAARPHRVRACVVEE